MQSQDYTVSVYSSKLGVPLNFVVHTHIVTQFSKSKNRYDVFAPFTLPSHIHSYSGHIYKNLLPPTTGFLFWYRKKKWWQANERGWRWQTILTSSTSGPEGSAAHKLFEFIENDGLKEYPYLEKYNLVLGPNSNTFTQWVTELIPECSLSLPWNAWGKGYKK